MALNGSEFLNNPWTTTFSPFTDLLGNGFYLIPIGFLAAALYVKTRNPVMTAAFLLGSSVLFESANLYMGYPEVEILFRIFTVLCLVGLVLGVYFSRKN